MKEILWAIIALFVAFLLLSIRIIVKRNGVFSSKHISQSKAMRDRGIGCATSQDREARKDDEKKIDVKEL